MTQVVEVLPRGGDAQPLDFSELVVEQSASPFLCPDYAETCLADTVANNSTAPPRSRSIQGLLHNRQGDRLPVPSPHGTPEKVESTLPFLWEQARLISEGIPTHLKLTDLERARTVAYALYEQLRSPMLDNDGSLRTHVITTDYVCDMLDSLIQYELEDGVLGLGIAYALHQQTAEKRTRQLLEEEWNKTARWLGNLPLDALLKN